MNSHKMLNMAALTAAAVEQSPYPYVIVPNFIHPEYLPSIQQDYPPIHHAGSFPLNHLEPKPAFTELVTELESDTLREIVAEKFAIDLTDRPVLITVRGHADRNDGKIHTDSKSKLITLLLYMNEEWQNDEGRLRLLYDNKNLDNYAVEVPPTAGTALFFKVTENGWHGHKPIIGARKVLQLNYITDTAALAKHQTRHRFSAKFKQWVRRLGWGGY